MPANDRYRQRRAAGLCTLCAVPSARAKCAACTAKYVASVRAKHEAWEAAGLCTACGGRRGDDHKWCSDCRDRWNQLDKKRKGGYPPRRRISGPKEGFALTLWKSYRMTVHQWNEMLGKQGGVCAICGGGPGKGGWHTDHCHASGRVRGILCAACNVGVGLFHDDPLLLQRAARYVVINGDAEKRQIALIPASAT